MWKISLILLALYSLGLLLLFLRQRSFMYHPEIASEAEFLARAPKSRLLPWRDENKNLIGWKRIPKARATKRMLIFHGNGGAAISRTYLMDGLEKRGDWEFYALEYPGYGSRAGAPTEAAILAAAQGALDELQHSDARPIFLAGESLGTGAACLLAGKNPRAVSGLFLVTPYTSASDIAVGRFPFYPVRSIMLDRFESAKALLEYSGPVAILLAGNDYIVPTRFGQKLFDDYHGPKKLWVQPSAGHNSLDFNPSAKWWRELEDFLVSP